MRKLNIGRVVVTFASERKRSQVFQGRRTRGVERIYDVMDGNFGSRNSWRFAVFIPDHWLKGTYVSVQPQGVPNRKAWAGLERRSIQLAPCTISAYRGKCYAKLAFSDVTEERNRIVLSAGQTLPVWMGPYRILRKARVTSTRALDGNALVAVLDKGDFVKMIRLFLALKPWALSGGFIRSNATA